MSFTLAIVGRPNVGKSTLFNRLVGKRLALVDDQPGVTRDLREGAARFGPLRFTVIDTAGLEEATDESLQGRMRALTERAVDMADVCLFLVDARAGVTGSDQMLAELLRKRAARVILVANKVEGRASEQGLLDASGLASASGSGARGATGSAWGTCCAPGADRAEFEGSSAIVEVDVEDEVDDGVDEEGLGGGLRSGGHRRCGGGRRNARDRFRRRDHREDGCSGRRP